MSPEASGTLKNFLSLLALSVTIIPALSAPALSLPRSLSSLFKPRDTGACPGTGILLSNHGSNGTFFLYPNDGNDWGQFSNPSDSIHLSRGERNHFIPLDPGFKGNVKKTDKLPATLVEFQLRDWIGKAWGDVSLEQGCSGPATISATDGTSNTNGFTYDILNDAPDAAFFKNTINSPVMTDGALDTTMGNWWGPANQAAITWEQEKVGQKKAYIVGGEGTDVVHSANGCLAVDFY